MKSRGYCFTINNYTVDDEDAVKALATDALYLVCGREIGKKCGTPHLQGYVHFKSQRSFDAIKRLLKRANLRAAKADALRNQQYCTKDSDMLIEHGTPPAQGERSDIDMARDIVRETGQMRQVALEARSMQSVRIAEVYLKYHETPRTWKTTVRWYYGPTGVGKSKYAREWLQDECPDDVYTALDSTKFWEGYDGHRGVIIDDYRKDFSKFHVLLQLLDRYEYRVEVKGSSRQMRATHLAITSPDHPLVTWGGRTTENLQQLLRRIDCIIALPSPAPPPGDRENFYLSL